MAAMTGPCNVEISSEPGSSKICAIHQPNFFPWLGYFDKIRRVDVFVFLDAVAYPKSGNSMGSWCNRVRVNVQGKSCWVGCAVRREHGVQLIKDVQFDDVKPWRQKLLRTLEINYRRCVNYERAMAVIRPLINFSCATLADFNIHAIRRLCKLLNITVEFRRQSEMKATGASSELLVNLTREVNCDAYLCGGGASGYQDDIVFERGGIKLIYQNYQEEAYCNSDSFIPDLSVLDFLMRGPTERINWN